MNTFRIVAALLTILLAILMVRDALDCNAKGGEYYLRAGLCIKDKKVIN